MPAPAVLLASTALGLLILLIAILPL